jgi:UDP-N-acetylglucosamine--N-acetylmuramyl-(pentapeptide) pyrophosphoryl-undecaprenol N-acetylglucosamine transferase
VTAAVVIMAGGTGGHVFPALAVAEQLRARGLAVSWLGTRRGIEAELVPAAGFAIDWISIGGLRGNGLLGWLTAPFRLGVALLQARRALARRRPAAVLGMGGFAAGPGGVAARLLGIPLLIHEQNAVAGYTNRMLAHFADRVLEAFPGSFPDRPGAVATGNPVRPAITWLRPPEVRMRGREGTLRVLVLGGSQGAAALNRVLPAALARVKLPVEILHQTGRAGLAATREAYQAAGLPAWVEPFIDDMAGAYDWADLVVCRSGALTVAELAAAGVAALLVPYPHAVDDHQTANAQFLVARDAARLLPQASLDAAQLAAELQALGNDRARLLSMACAARRAARPLATEQVVAECLRFVPRGARGVAL